jgi:hypothetical protein
MCGILFKNCGSSTTDAEIEVSDNDKSEDDIIALHIEGSVMAAARTASLSLIAVLVEKSRCDNINFLRDNFSN